MQWHPRNEIKELMKFYLDCLQATAIIAAGIWAAATFHFQSRDQAEAIQRELRRPYDERQLALYLDAAKVVAQLASPEIKEKAEAEKRFWELYYGELAFVESRAKDQISARAGSSVEGLMVEFCNQYFGVVRCRPPEPKLKNAIDLSHYMADEIRAKWAPKTR